jgi:bifunctional DNase/RNase
VNELEVVGVRIQLPTNQPVVVLRDSVGNRYLPIWVGALEASAIALAQQGVVAPRPLTHDLIKEVLTALGRTIKEVRITELKEGTFYGEIVFDGDTVVSARPSDAIAIALRVGAPILASEEVLSEAGMSATESAEEEVEKFREFLDQINPEDFNSPG